MRYLIAAAVVAGCYAPSVPAGAPCDPLANHCPAGQACRQVAGAFVCTSGPGDPTIEDDAGIDGPSPEPDAAIDAPSGPVEETYTATVAECVDPNDPDPAACRAANGNDQLVVDEVDAMTGAPWVGFVRFDLDTALQGRTITSVTLRLTASSDDDADSDDTGSIWRVTPFTLQSLSTTVPTNLDASALAPSQGPITSNDVFDFTLPTSLVTPGSPVYLCIKPENSNGTNYWNTSGPKPPQLIVTAE